jgi:MHS family proline/betaine transporter-like MFS transporter
MAIAAEAEALAVSHSTPKALQIAAAVIGNALEWYDFIIFGMLTIVISRLFFPSDSQYASLLLTTATFGVGFFMRPVGGVLLGIYADRKGRKAALQLIIGLMTVAIGMIAFAPTYAAIGIAAPMIMVLARLLQGFATGGEFASATSFLIESAPSHRRGFYGSWQMVGQGTALLLGALVSAAVTRGLSPEALEGWGWRIPFLLGLIIAPVGLYIRRYLNETDAFTEASVAPKREGGFGAILATYFKQTLVCLGIGAAGTISFYVTLSYMPTYANTQLGLPLGDAFIVQSIGLVCLVLMVLLCGAVSDRLGRKPILIGAFGLYLVLAYPLFAWVNQSPSISRLLLMQVVLCSLHGAFNGPFSTAFVEQFPTRIRSTGSGIPYNLSVMVFGGPAQFFVTWLIQATGSPIAPVFYLMFGMTLGLVASLFLVERAHDARLPALVTIPPSIGAA